MFLNTRKLKTQFFIVVLHKSKNYFKTNSNESFLKKKSFLKTFFSQKKKKLGMKKDNKFLFGKKKLIFLKWMRYFFFDKFKRLKLSQNISKNKNFLNKKIPDLVQLRKWSGIYLPQQGIKYFSKSNFFRMFNKKISLVKNIYRKKFRVKFKLNFKHVLAKVNKVCFNLYLKNYYIYNDIYKLRYITKFYLKSKVKVLFYKHKYIKNNFLNRNKYSLLKKYFFSNLFMRNIYFLKKKKQFNLLSFYELKNKNFFIYLFCKKYYLFKYFLFYNNQLKFNFFMKLKLLKTQLRKSTILNLYLKYDRLKFKFRSYLNFLTKFKKFKFFPKKKLIFLRNKELKYTYNIIRKRKLVNFLSLYPKLTFGLLNSYNKPSKIFFSRIYLNKIFLKKNTFYKYKPQIYLKLTKKTKRILIFKNLFKIKKFFLYFKKLLVFDKIFSMYYGKNIKKVLKNKILPYSYSNKVLIKKSKKKNLILFEYLLPNLLQKLFRCVNPSIAIKLITIGAVAINNNIVTYSNYLCKLNDCIQLNARYLLINLNYFRYDPYGYISKLHTIWKLTYSYVVNFKVLHGIIYRDFTVNFLQYNFKFFRKKWLQFFLFFIN